MLLSCLDHGEWRAMGGWGRDLFDWNDNQITKSHSFSLELHSWF